MHLSAHGPSIIWVKRPDLHHRAPQPQFGPQYFFSMAPPMLLLSYGAELRESDSGSYTCLAVSETGETSWTAHLRVRHPSSPSVVFHRMPDASTFPAAPSRPSVDVATETGVSLSWQPVSDHGASPVISYIVEYYSEHCSEVNRPSVSSFICLSVCPSVRLFQ